MLKFLYLLSTLFCIFVGFFLLFGKVEYLSPSFFSSYPSYSASTFLHGLILLIVGPVVLRILYEGAMLLIIAVRNLVEINRKLGAKPGSASDPIPNEEDTKDAESSSVSNESSTLYCSQCGTPYDKSAGVCPNCGKT